MSATTMSRRTMLAAAGALPVLALTRRAMGQCVILPTFYDTSLFVTRSWSASLTTVPLLESVTWSGDTGTVDIIIADGHQIRTSWDTPGTKIFKALCGDSTLPFTVVVHPCTIFKTTVSRSMPLRNQTVLITADHVPSSFEIEWSGDLGVSPDELNDAIITRYDEPGLKIIFATCGGPTFVTTLTVSNITEEEDQEAVKKADEARQEVKKAAEQFSSDETFWAITTGMAALLLTGPVAIGFGLAAAAHSYGAWESSNLAKDPPREDIDIVSLFVAPDFNLPSPADDTEATILQLVIKIVSIAVCMRNLVESIERADGAFGAAINSENLESIPFLAEQAAAVSHNASVGANLIRELLLIVQPVNQAYQVIKSRLDEEDVDTESLHPEEIRTQLTTKWNEQKSMIFDQLGLSETDMTDMDHAVQVNIDAIFDRVRLPATFFNEEREGTVDDLSQRLQDLAVAYDGLIR